MRLNPRQRAILREVEGRDYVEVKDLARRLDVDASTIRRDLQPMVRSDLVERLHGGVRRRGAVEDAVPSATPMAAVAPEGGAAAIAWSARRMVRSGETIALGAGPCTDHLVTTLYDLEDLTVITTDLRAADKLARHPQIHVVVAGGDLRDAPGSSVVSGAGTAAFLAEQEADWAFVEVEGVHPYSGLTTSFPWRVSAARALLDAAQRRVVLAPSATFGTRCVGFIVDTSDVDLIITDDYLDDADLPAFGGRVVRGATESHEEWRTHAPTGWWPRR